MKDSRTEGEDRGHNYILLLILSLVSSPADYFVPYTDLAKLSSNLHTFVCKKAALNLLSCGVVLIKNAHLN